MNKAHSKNACREIIPNSLFIRHRFPKDFFSTEHENTVNNDTNNSSNKINSTFDHSSQDLLNKNFDNNQSTGAKNRKRSYRVLNRNYTKLTKESGSEHRSLK